MSKKQVLAGDANDTERVASQRHKFEEMARALGVDESPESLDRIMDKLDLRHKPKSQVKTDTPPTPPKKET